MAKPLEPIRSIPKLGRRRRESHKGDFGRVLIVGGSVGMVGAPALAANAALRGGAGLVKLACPDVCQQTVAGLAMCATSVPLASNESGCIGTAAIRVLLDLADEHDVLAIGPGMGRGVGEVVHALVAVRDRPKVIDADALNALAETGHWWRSAESPVVLTPHPGEMRRLLEGARLDVDVSDRQACAAALSELTGAIVVLKGSGTVVTDGESVYVNTTGNPGMATAGAGDVLTGLVAALIGQGMSALDAAVLGAYLHGTAGDLAAEALGEVCVTASDLVDCLPDAFVQ